MIVRQLLASEFEVYRTIRLRALRGDSAAFDSSYEREALFDEATWARRLTSLQGRAGAVFVAEISGRSQGMMGLGHGPTSGQAVVWGMWADPAVRRRGVGRQLLTAGHQWARNQGLRSISLEVFPESVAAVALYRSAGFSQETVDDSSRKDRQSLTMTLSIGGDYP